MKRRFLLIFLAILALGLFTGCGKEEKEDEPSNEIVDVKDASVEDGKYLSGLHHVEIVIKDFGTICAELDADTAPITVTNFIELCNENFYDGISFHRIMYGFMMQGGDPEGTGMGGSGRTITGEFSQNKIQNGISHVRGTRSMARSSKMNSASSQFFIVQMDSTYLDGQYAGFGYVTSGMDVVDTICSTTPVLDNNGSVAPENRPIIDTIKVID